ncbi:unnamed protein product [Phaeothamnion confervicola]
MGMHSRPPPPPHAYGVDMPPMGPQAMGPFVGMAHAMPSMGPPPYAGAAMMESPRFVEEMETEAYGGGAKRGNGGGGGGGQGGGNKRATRGNAGGGGGEGGEGAENAQRKLARFVRHATLPDGAAVAPGAPLKKTWVVRNDSARAWPETCELAAVSGGKDFGAPAAAPAPGAVAPGEEVELSVRLTAPVLPGSHEAFWRLREVGGKRFGQRLWARIMVEEGSGCLASGGGGGNDEGARLLANMQGLNLK